jgi:hypothetical protein
LLLENLFLEYTASTGALGTFKNLGKATKGYLSANGNLTPDGTFFFNCVGYTKEGKLKLVADRVIQTGISLSNIFANNTPDIVSGKSIVFDTETHTIRLLDTLSDKIPSTKGGEYDGLITNSLDNTKTIDQLWHNANCLSWTNTISAEKSNYIIAKGLGDESLIALNQRHFLYTDSASNLGFRPVLIIEPNTRLEKLIVTPYVGYEKDTTPSITVDAVVVLADGSVSEYALVKTDSDADTITFYSNYSTDEIRILDVTKLNVGKTSISIMEKTTKEIVYSFDVFRDAKYRSSTSRTFGEIYDGYTLTDSEVIGTVVKPKTSSLVTPTVSGEESYIAINSNTVKITDG